MQTKTSITLLSAVLIGALLTGCGGAATSDSGGIGGGGTSSYRLGTGAGADFIPTKMKASSTVLQAGQTTILEFNIVDSEHKAIDTPVNLTLSSRCLNSAESTITGGRTIRAIGGKAVAEYKAGSCTGEDVVTATLGSATANITLTIGGSGNNSYRLGIGSGADFIPTKMKATSAVLLAGQTTTIEVNVVDNEQKTITTPVNLTFSSRCVASGESTITGGETIKAIGGKAVAEYKVGSCKGEDVVTASLGSATASVALTIDIRDTETRNIGSGIGESFVKGAIDVGIGNSTLSPGGSTTLSVYIVNSRNESVSEAFDVTFSSSCISSENAVISGGNGNTITTKNGKAVATYTSAGCAGIGGIDVITATTIFQSSTLTATASINVKADTPQTISFVDAKPALVNLKGTGGQETSVVRFKVVGQAGNPVKGVCVTFAPSTTVGGLNLVPSKCGPNSPESFGSTSDANGIVSTIVQAGTIPTAVSITATIENNISTQSSALAVTTGIPDQNSISLSLTDIQPVSWRHDNIESQVNIRMADAFNNPVPNGTPVTFTTSGGAIDGSCETKSGACSVTWRSQSPRPHLDPSPNLPSWTFGYDNNGFALSCANGATECRDGRVRILATAIGNESFIDGNSNGQYDDIDTDIFVNSNGIFKTDTKSLTINNTASCSPSEPRSFASQIGNISNSCDDLREAYLDKNFSKDRNITEEFVDFNQNGLFDLLPNGKYDGALCSGAAKNNGDCTTNKVNVRAETTLVMSSEFLYPIRLVFDSSAKTATLPNGSFVKWDGTIKQPVTSSSSASSGASSSAPSGRSIGFTLLLADENGNSLPAGTTIVLDTTNLPGAKLAASPTKLTESREPTLLSITGSSNDKGSFIISVKTSTVINDILVTVE